MYYKLLFCLLFILINFILNSCRYEKYFFNHSQSFKTWQKHRESLLKVKKYQIRGVITCSMFKTSWKRFSFVCQKINDEHYKFIFFSPIGFKNIEINILEHGVCTSNKNIKNCYSVDYFERIIQELLHLNISFKNFKAWIIGLPGYECDYTLNTTGYLKEVYYQCNDNHFIILYKSYYSSKPPIFPKTMEVLYNNYCFNIKIYNWKIQ